MLRRDNPGEVQLATKLCERNFGKADWNNSGKGTKFGILTCTFKTAKNTVAFLHRLVLYNFTIEAWR
jgi:hypothetical protein